MIKIASNRLSEDNKKFLTVKTLSGSNPDKYYKKSRKFYKAMGFYPLEEMPELWSEEEPCLYMVKVLDDYVNNTEKMQDFFEKWAGKSCFT